MRRSICDLFCDLPCVLLGPFGGIPVHSARNEKAAARAAFINNIDVLKSPARRLPLSACFLSLSDVDAAPCLGCGGDWDYGAQHCEYSVAARWRHPLRNPGSEIRNFRCSHVFDSLLSERPDSFANDIA